MAVCLILAICLSGCHHQVQKAACCNAELKKEYHSHCPEKKSVKQTLTINTTTTTTIKKKAHKHAFIKNFPAILYGKYIKHCDLDL